MRSFRTAAACIALTGCFLAPAAMATTGNMLVTETTTLTEDHHGEIVVAASGVTLDCAGHRVVGPGLAGVRLGSVTGVTVKNCGVSGFTVGILVGASERSVIRDNLAEANDRYGFVLSAANDNALSGNRAVNNGFGSAALGGGFAIARSSGNSLVGNVAERNRDDGFRLGDGSTENRLIRNTAIGNTFSGFSVFASNGNLFALNSSTANDSSGLLFVASDKNTIIANDASRNGFGGIDVRDGSDTNRVHANRAAGNRVPGILVLNGAGNTVSLNSTPNNGFAGIDVRGLSTDTKVELNHAQDNGLYGILVTGGTSGTILSHNLNDGNEQDGIRVDDAPTELTRNTANSNVLLGIRAVPGVTDGGGNRARRNGDVRQCVEVTCR